MLSFDISAAPLLPVIWQHVFTYLKTRDLKTCSLICRQFQEQAVPLLWSAPTFHRQITPGELAKLSNLQLIHKLSTTQIQWDDWDDFESLVEKNNQIARDLVKVIKTIKHFKGLVVDGGPRREITLEMLQIIAPYICVLQTGGIRLNKYEEAKLVDILQQYKHKIKQITINSELDYRILQKMDLEVKHITLGRLRGWRENLDEVVIHLTTVKNVDIVECAFRLTEFKKIVCLSIRKIDMSLNLRITDNNYYEFIHEMSAMQTLRELEIPYYSDCGYQFNTLLNIVKLIDLHLLQLRNSTCGCTRYWKKTWFV